MVALVCGGGCAQYAQYNTADLYRPYCDDFETVFRQSLAENVEELLRRFASAAANEPAERPGMFAENYG